MAILWVGMLIVGVVNSAFFSRLHGGLSIYTVSWKEPVINGFDANGAVIDGLSYGYGNCGYGVAFALLYIDF